MSTASRGWLAVANRIRAETVRARLMLVAGSVAFYAFLAIFPLLIGIVSLYGLVADPSDVQRELSPVGGAIPSDAREVLHDQLSEIVARSETQLGFTVLVSVVLALVAASAATYALIWGVNIAYGRAETRGYFKLKVLALAMTAVAMAFVVVALVLIAALPYVLPTLGLGRAFERALWLGRWPFLGIALVVGLSLLYRYAPNRPYERFRWLSWGAVIATVLWLLVSIGLSLYAAHFSSYNETYGALGGVIALLGWLYASSFAILFGAKINAEIERHSAERRSHELGTDGVGYAL